MIAKILSRSLLAATAAVIAVPAFAQQMLSANVYMEDVFTHPSQGDVRMVEGARGTLLTTPDGAWASLETRELTPGHAYTLWFVPINNPAACEHTPCEPSDVVGLSAETQSDVGFGDGAIAAPDGTAHFVTYRPVGDIPGAWFGTGLQAPEEAEIHLVVRDHGPLIEGMEHNMLTTFRGGCTDESIPDMIPAAGRADGEVGPFACADVQFVIFEQLERQAAVQ